MKDDKSVGIIVIRTDLGLKDIQTVQRSQRLQGITIPGVMIEPRASKAGKYAFVLNDAANAVAREPFELTSKGRIMLYPKTRNYKSLKAALLRYLTILCGHEIIVTGPDSSHWYATGKGSVARQAEKEARLQHSRRFLRIGSTQGYMDRLLSSMRRYPVISGDLRTRVLLADFRAHITSGYRDRVLPLVRDWEMFGLKTHNAERNIRRMIQEAAFDELDLEINLIEDESTSDIGQQPSSSVNRYIEKEQFELAIKQALKGPFFNANGDLFSWGKQMRLTDLGESASFMNFTIARGMKDEKPLENFFAWVDSNIQGFLEELAELEDETRLSKEKANVSIARILSEIEEDRSLKGKCESCP